MTSFKRKVNRLCEKSTLITLAYSSKFHIPIIYNIMKVNEMKENDKKIGQEGKYSTKSLVNAAFTS